MLTVISCLKRVEIVVLMHILILFSLLLHILSDNTNCRHMRKGSANMNSKDNYQIDTYHIGLLKKNDKALVDILDKAEDLVLSDDVVDDYIDIKKVSGNTVQGLYRDLLIDFIGFLRDRIEFFKVDVIIDKIDGYASKNGSDKRGLCLSSK